MFNVLNVLSFECKEIILGQRGGGKGEREMGGFLFFAFVTW